MSEENQDLGNTEISVEQEARAQGWVDKEEFRGNENEWVDAETFVKRGKEILPVLKKNNEKLLQRLAKAEKDAEEARQTAKEFREFQKQTFERKAKELESEINRLKSEKKQAIAQGDGERVVEIDDAIDNIKEEQRAAQAEAAKPVSQPEAPNIIDPVLSSWMERNSWFGTDKRLTGLANGIGEEIRMKDPSLTGQDFLDALDKELAKELGSRRQVNNPVEGRTNTRPTSTGKRSYENLPAEAKAACDKFVKQGLMTKEQYLADYDWE